MEQQRKPYSVYTAVDERQRITAVNSDAFLSDLSGWTKIDEGFDSRCRLAQHNYFPKPLYTPDGIPRYKLQDGKAVERTEEEIQADREARPTPEPAPAVEELRAKIAALTTSNQMLEDCLVEMAGVIYA